MPTESTRFCHYDFSLNLEGKKSHNFAVSFSGNQFKDMLVRLVKLGLTVSSWVRVLPAPSRGASYTLHQIKQPV